MDASLLTLYPVVFWAISFVILGSRRAHWCSSWYLESDFKIYSIYVELC